MNDYIGLQLIEAHFPMDYGASLIIGDIILSWSRVSDKITVISKALAAQPECSAIGECSQARFRRRASHLDKQLQTYFQPTPTMRTLLSRLYNHLLTVQEDRDLVAHGKYGHQFMWEKGQTGKPTMYLMLRGKVRSNLVTRTYSQEEFQAVAVKIREIYSYLDFLSAPRPSSITKSLREIFGIPPAEIDQAQNLVERIQSHCQSTTPSQYPQPPQRP